MKKEFNLSKKRMSPEEFYEYQGGYKEEDIKEFIKRRNDLVEYWFGDLVEFKQFKKERDKLAGSKLVKGDKLI